MTNRLDRCKKMMADRNLKCFLVTEINNVRYLSGFTGSSGACLLTETGGYFVTDGRYRLQAPREVQSLEIRIEPQSTTKELTELLKTLGTPIGFEAEHTSVARLKRLQEETGAEYQPVEGLVEDLRRVKDPDEIRLIQEAVEIVDTTFERILSFLKPGLTEREIAIELDIQMLRLGAEAFGFESIVAAGPNSAFPHARPSDRPVQRGDFLTMDFGALRQGYNSDITRTVVIGEAGVKEREIYSAVLEAQLKAVAAVRAGIRGQEVDAVARESITAAGYGKQFSHNLGHSLGRSVHDGPALGRTVERELEVGMVVTVEPGIYVEGLGGVRIEDDVVVRANGCDILTKSPKELRII